MHNLLSAFISTASFPNNNLLILHSILTQHFFYHKIQKKTSEIVSTVVEELLTIRATVRIPTGEAHNIVTKLVQVLAQLEGFKKKKISELMVSTKINPTFSSSWRNCST